MSKKSTDSKETSTNKALLEKLVVAFVVAIYLFIYVKILFL